MAQIINAIYEEGVLKPLGPLDIKEHTNCFCFCLADSLFPVEQSARLLKL